MDSFFGCCTNRGGEAANFASRQQNRASAYETSPVRPLQRGHASAAGDSVIKISQMPSTVPSPSSSSSPALGPEPHGAPDSSRHSGAKLPGSPTKCGVGIVFRPLYDPEPSLSVWTVAPDSPAGELGGFEKGDILTHVGDKDVRGLPPQDVAPLIVGPEGTIVRLKFSRGGREKLEVALPRKWG
uniref:PDZ domain-containing protein n=1 Tax=Hemiselmis andersenii TaxID=464988 RepID=A0A6T8PAJ9_HEMAN|mmetsp:Transcript_38039/g.88820  ORF Transcript_38039/g.88820 Transcript_38039/m.88820 type:complete len:184 (-) Transcript_38039:124-675(-)